MSQVKTCTKIEDLVCGNCIHSIQCDYPTPARYCKLHPPSNDYNLVNNPVANSHTCGAGQWYCELHRSIYDFPGPSPVYRTSSKSAAVSSFMDRIRENNIDKDSDEKQIIMTALRQVPSLFPSDKTVLLWDFRIPPKSVFLTDRTIEFTVKADVEFK